MKRLPRRLRKLQRRAMRKARKELNLGNLHYADYIKVLEVVSTEDGLRTLEARIRGACLSPWEGPDRLMGMGVRELFSNLWDWFVANWPAILKIIITIAPLLLEPKYEDR